MELERESTLVMKQRHLRLRLVNTTHRARETSPIKELVLPIPQQELVPPTTSC